MFENSILEAFSRFKLYKNNKEILFTELEKYILICIESDKSKNNLLIMPKDKDYLLLVTIIYSALKMCYYNVFQGDTDILDVINEGDIIQYNKSLCSYEGREGELLKLKFKDGMIRLPVSSRYKLSKYLGDAKSLNKMPTRSISTSKKTKNLLAEIMNINIDEICKISKKSELIIENKQRINELIKTLKIKIGDNEKVDLTEVFPMAYYSSIDNIYYYKGNSKKEEPIVKFTSKIYVANELCKKFKNISSVLFLPNKLGIDELSELKEIERKKNISKITSIISPIDLERNIDNEYIHEDFNIRNLNINLENCINIKQFNEKQYEYYKNYSKNNVQIKKVQNIEISKLRKEITKACTLLMSLFPNDSEFIKLIINARKITKRIVSIPIPLKSFDEMIFKQYPSEMTIALWENFEKDFLNLIKRNISNDIKINLNKIYYSIESLYKIISEKNEKWNILSAEILSSNTERILVFNDNKFVRYGIRNYIKSYFPYKYNILVDKPKVNNKVRCFDKIIFTGLLEDNIYNNYRKFNTKQVVCIFYSFENSYYQYLRKRYNNFLNNIQVNNDEKSEEFVESKVDIYTDQDIKRELKLEVELEELLITNYDNVLNSNNTINQTMNLCSKVLKFNDGRKCFITKQFNAYELDIDREEIIIRKPNEIAVGQVLVFVDDFERDIVESTIRGLLKIDTIKEIYEKAYNQSKEWKKILKEYMNENKYTYRDLQKNIKRFGITRTGATIRSWVMDSIVGPQEQEIFYAMAHMTQNEYFIKNYNEIYESCNLIRSFQIKVRKVMAKSLLRVKIRDDNDEIDNIIMDNIYDKFNYVIKVEVVKVFNIDKEIPSYLTNKVLEE